MRILKLWPLVSLFIPLAASLPIFAASPDPSCQVSKVVDGDTLHLVCGGITHKVRLLGYDTPEIYHPLCPAEKQAGDAATDLMRQLTETGPVTNVRFTGHDRYGRDLADVEIAGHDVAAYMLSTPLARPYQGHKHPDWCAILGS